MSEPEVASTEADHEALKALQADASELERIEGLLDRFNAFETIPRFDKDEEMHSNLLASLLDPKRTGVLAKRLIRELLRETLDTGLGRVRENLDGMDFSNTLVRREYHHVDVLLTNEDHKLAVIIENKVEAGEGPGQLDWYDRIIRHTHPGWDVHHVFLSPSGFTPSHRAYVPLRYEKLCDIVDRVAEDGGSAIDPEVRVPAQHYARMVRRRILGDPDAVRLAQDLYQKHKRAFEFVYSHRPDVRKQVRNVVEDLIAERPELEPDASRKDNIKFVVGEWDNAPALMTAEDWTGSGRILIFEIWNNPDSLDVHLYIGPGPETIREGILDAARRNPEVFAVPRSVSGKWVRIFTRHLLT
ncbi:MAG: hypothetical protein AVDCRST_MAG93-1974, partial [uncultured Chloroflexia bacterium]